MIRAFRAALITLSIGAATLLVHASPASAAACSTRSSSTVTGGYVVTIHCGGSTGFIDGYGSTLTDANAEALNLYALYVTYGVLCDGRSVNRATGGYVVTNHCGGIGFVDGYGTTLSGAAFEARSLGKLYGETGVACDGRSANTATGGYVVTNHCGGIGFVDGYGTTLSDAAFETRALAQLYADTGRACDGRSSRTVSGGYEVTLHCGGGLGFIDGQGSTLTGAAQIARLSASIG